jgi:hypothetical protein
MTRETAVAGVDPRTHLTEAPQPYRVQRDGERDLSFTGWLIGEGEVSSGKMDPEKYAVTERRVSVRVFVTQGGRFVGHVHRRWRFEEEYRDDARVCDDGQALLDFLRETNNWSLGQASRDAWNAACKKFPPLAPLEVEVVE